MLIKSIRLNHQEPYRLLLKRLRQSPLAQSSIMKYFIAAVLLPAVALAGLPCYKCPKEGLLATHNIELDCRDPENNYLGIPIECDGSSNTPGMCLKQTGKQQDFGTRRF